MIVTIGIALCLIGMAILAGIVGFAFGLQCGASICND